ncbi:MAG: undecaprenyl-diphosphate phosphatase [Candidatus Omnitrophica bacterium]|nr:undecaprenyl-diphosphate phosphatase [Candidatus Omnitrophota bacterium]
MMTILQAAILGVVQGLTGFLPVSGAAHLVLIQHWFGLKDDLFVFNIAAHWGTVFALIIFLARDIQKILAEAFLFLVQRPQGADRTVFLDRYPYAMTVVFMILSSIVTVLVGVFFKEIFEFTFRSVLAVGLAWLVMGGLLMNASRIKSLDPEREMTQMHHRDAFFIGLAQGLALIPGISGSGAMILMGLQCGLNRHTAIRYAFLLSIPLTLGVGVYRLGSSLPLLADAPSVYGTGFLCSLGVGLLGIKILFQLLERGKFHYFGYYCLAAGLLAIASQFLKS